MPQLSLTGTLPSYERAIVPVIQPDGSTQFRAPHARRRPTLGVTRAAAAAVHGRSMLRDVRRSQRVDVGGVQASRVYNSTPVTIGISQDIFRPNTISWDSREQDLRATVGRP